MKTFIIACFALATLGYADEVPLPRPSAYGYLLDIGVPEAERIRKAEEINSIYSRIVGGVPAGEGQYPYQAGLLLSIAGEKGIGVCGGSLITPNRVATAAHCWYDGRNQVWSAKVVLGSNKLFTGGTRVESSVVALHPYWIPLLVRNDVAVIYLPRPVQLSAKIATIPLATENDDFAGSTAIALGFGLTSTNGNIEGSQFLNHVRLNIIANKFCRLAYPFIIQASNICTSGIGGVGACSGDSGGPLVVNHYGQNILVGITSFGSGFGCEINLPSVFSRVSSFTAFFDEHTQ